MQRRISVALVATALLLVAFAPTTFAECMTWPLEASEHPRVAYAFVATVTDVEQEEMFEEGSGHYRYEVTLRTEQTYRGRVPDRLELTGTYAGCSFVRVDALTEGETVFVASERLSPTEWETQFDDALVWRQVGSAWGFHEDALAYASDEDYYWPAARTATTTAAILQIVSDAPLPDTGTAPEQEGRGQRGSLDAGITLALVTVFAVAFGAMYRAGLGRPETLDDLDR